MSRAQRMFGFLLRPTLFTFCRTVNHIAYIGCMFSSDLGYFEHRKGEVSIRLNEVTRVAQTTVVTTVAIATRENEKDMYLHLPCRHSKMLKEEGSRCGR